MKDEMQAHTEGRTGHRPTLQELRREFERRQALWAGRETRRSWSRLLLFAAAIVPWFFWSGVPLLAGGLTLAAVVLFVVAVRMHLAAQAEREMADRLLMVLEESERRSGGGVVCIRSHERPADAADVDGVLPAPLERGRTWPLTDQERDDLDLFAAPVGVFGLLNRTSSAVGARRLRDRLENPNLDAERIRGQQQTCRWLEDNPSQRLHILAGLAALRREDARLARLIGAIAAIKPVRLGVPALLLRGWSILSTAYVLWALARAIVGDYQWSTMLVPLLVLNVLLLWRMKPVLAEVLFPWRGIGWAVRGVRVAAQQAAEVLPDAGDLGRLRTALREMLDSGALRCIQRRSGWSEHGGMGYALINAVALTDAHAALSMARDVLPHRAVLLAGISAVAELDAAVSVGCFAAEQPLRCYPEPHETTRLEIEDGVHPLLPPERAVPNGVSLDAGCRLWLITGSNMAGKSTFLRMLGVNVLLAQIGSAVCARSMRWTPARLITDLRARDNLAASESYFLSEVRHLRRLVVPQPGDGPILGLIDEPFRGTNSHDQSAASVAVVEHLLSLPHLFLIATHDRCLTRVCDGERSRNYHFQENLNRDGMVFDYRLYEGPARTRNALKILEIEGYPPALVERAHAWSEAAGDEHE